MLFDQYGEENGVNWSVVHEGGRNFIITVGKISEIYHCAYEPIFGLDVDDVAGINRVVDRLFDELSPEVASK
ncbi:hypothetical protein NS115_03845 [Paenibacillus jamilae]|uniref:Uncharacterized protein n=1 Tax=Paenibacillus jamilae TaxID=114136 RepID=A0ACC4ZZG2_9BACL|nr:hypothetical protein [Paenibacillus jamilae]KTS84471.1 hypothetical protein NS115_03845 [Paenibacillus jamilae]